MVPYTPEVVRVMPFSYEQYAGDGSNQLFLVPFPYIVRAHVKVFIDYDLADGVGTELEDGTDFTWRDDTSIETTVPPAVDEVLTVIRKTPADTRLVIFQNGSPPTPNELNLSGQQGFYLNQEQADHVDVGILTSQEAVDQANIALEAAEAALEAASKALSYAPIVNVAAIPPNPEVGMRIEVQDSTGIEDFTPLTGIPSGFTGSPQLKVRMVYAETRATTWEWFDYSAPDPDGRYLQITKLSSATNSTSEDTAATSLAVKTTRDVANEAASTAEAARQVADDALPLAGGHMQGQITFIPFNSGLHNPNILINPNFRINQRGYVATTPTTAYDQFVKDRWRLIVQGDSTYWETNGGIFTMHVGSGGIRQIVEASNCPAGSYAISWYGTAACFINGVQVEKGESFAWTGVGGMEVAFFTGSVSCPKLEYSSIATPWTPKGRTEEWLECCRYYIRYNNISFNGGGGVEGSTQSFTIQFPTQMRAAPFANWTSPPGQFNLAAFNIDALSQQTARCLLTSVGAGNYSCDFTGDAYFDFSAEIAPEAGMIEAHRSPHS